jgi:hypothetical protein
VQFEAKDPRGFAVFKQALAEHSALGAANTQLGCQKERPSLYHLQNEMADASDGLSTGTHRPQTLLKSSSATGHFGQLTRR